MLELEGKLPQLQMIIMWLLLPVGGACGPHAHHFEKNSCALHGHTCLIKWNHSIGRELCKCHASCLIPYT